MYPMRMLVGKMSQGVFMAKVKSNSFKDHYLELIFSLFILIVTMLLFSQFTHYVELRQGVMFTDPILSQIKALDLTWPIFSTIYGAIILALVILSFHLERMIFLFYAYSLMVLIRMLMMYLLPLDPPAGMIFLQDPFVSFFVVGKTLTKDLFFSGHTATIFLLFLVVPKRFKSLFLVISAAVAIGVLFQKVHYTIDVVVAPFVSFTSYYLVGFFKRSDQVL